MNWALLQYLYVHSFSSIPHTLAIKPILAEDKVKQSAMWRIASIMTWLVNSARTSTWYRPSINCIAVSYPDKTVCIISSWQWYQHAFYWTLLSKQVRKLKGAVDKYNIHLLACCSKENFEISQYQKFQPIRPMRFHFIWFLWTTSYPECLISHCIVLLLKSTSKNRNCFKYQYLSKRELN